MAVEAEETTTPRKPAAPVVDEPVVKTGPPVAHETGLDGRTPIVSTEQELRHLNGCPSDPARVEKYPSRIAPRNNRDGDRIPSRDVIVVRCVECGESVLVGK